MKYLIASVLATILTLVVALLLYVGAFKPVTVAIEEAGPFRMVYKSHIGPYHKIVPTIEEVEKWAAANGEPCTISFGEYLDDPRVVDEDRLRSFGGCLVEGDWTDRLPEGFQFKEVPRQEYVTAIFTGAPSISPLKVYPKAFKYMESMNLKHEGAIIEMYEKLPNSGIRTRYLFSFVRANH